MDLMKILIKKKIAECKIEVCIFDLIAVRAEWIALEEQ